MTEEQIKKILTLLGLLALSGCGANLASSSDGSALAITLSNSKTFDSTARHGKVELYRIEIDADGLENPITAQFPGDATEGVIEGVPCGGGRRVSVEAVNPNDSVILAGESEGIEIGEDVTEVNVKLEAVPIFTNIANGSQIENTRLVFRMFSDPSHALVVEEVGSDSALPIVDADTNLNEVRLDSSTGLGRLSPQLVEPGTHTFKVSDVDTGRSSQVSVLLLNGNARRPAPLAAAGRMAASAASVFGASIGF